MKKLLAIMMLMISASAMAEPQAGNEYVPVVQVLPTDNPNKIEVTEIFWYGCPHCYQLEPQLSAWVKKLPGDVVFKRVPGVPRPDWAPMAKAYFTLEDLGLVEKLHGALFDAIHKERVLKPNDDQATINWLTNKSGLDRKKIEDTYNSFSTNSKVMRAAQIFRASGATGVPSLVIDGKYITSGTMAGGNDALLETAQYLINKAKKEKGLK
jgi:thiol:disulfide interchange protein DsbA